MTFFIILGVLLFDMVTGIILDTFGALREEVAEREEKMNNETFVSGLTRQSIEEIEGNSIDFETLNTGDQNQWNYLYVGRASEASEAIRTPAGATTRHFRIVAFCDKLASRSVATRCLC